MFLTPVSVVIEVVILLYALLGKIRARTQPRTGARAMGYSCFDLPGTFSDMSGMAEKCTY